MAKPKKKLTPAQRREKKHRKAEFVNIFINGKQKRIRRTPSMIEGQSDEEFIRNNADPIWLHQNKMWEYMEPDPALESDNLSPSSDKEEDDSVLPF